jgi:hypothetical protein
MTHLDSSKEGKRDLMIHKDGTCSCITTYSYDENDRLTCVGCSMSTGTPHHGEQK